MTIQIPTAAELEAATPDVLQALTDAVSAEQGRRRAAAEFMVLAAAQLQEARDAGAAPTPEDGAPWVQPTSALDAYKAGDIVVHNGIRWASLTTPNVWRPGESGWRAISNADGSTDGGDTGSGAMPYVPPTGQHDAYKAGDLVTYQGKTYSSKIDGNVWTPTDYPAGWEEVTP